MVAKQNGVSLCSMYCTSVHSVHNIARLCDCSELTGTDKMSGSGCYALRGFVTQTKSQDQDVMQKFRTGYRKAAPSKRTSYLTEDFTEGGSEDESKSGKKEVIIYFILLNFYAIVLLILLNKEIRELDALCPQTKQDMINTVANTKYTFSDIL
jgi:hypothetical protein